METSLEKHRYFINFVLEFSAISVLGSWGSREALNSSVCFFHAYTLAESMCACVH